MDFLRAQAYLDLLNGITAADRIAGAVPHDDAADAAESLAWAESRAARTAGAGGAATPCASTPSRSTNVTIATSQPATSPATGSATSSRSGTAPARSRPATGTPERGLDRHPAQTRLASMANAVGPDL
jgi:hypothetical protein